MQTTNMGDAPVMDEAGIRKFFFDARVRELKEGTGPPDVPGVTRVTFRGDDGVLFLQDLCCVGPRGSSASMLTISLLVDGQHIPVWYMFCSGYCRTKEARQFLELALLETYGAGRFIGGRGPSRFQERRLIYSNKPILENFGAFSGGDTIFLQDEQKPGKFVGGFRYNGGFL